MKMTNLTEEQDLGRAKNAVGGYFDRKLSIPKIFFNADWDGDAVDVLAIDRTGIGDVHLIELSPDVFQASPDAFDFVFSRELEALVKKMLLRRAQYRHIAVRTRSISAADRNQMVRGWDVMDTFAESGIGRVGLLALDISAGEPEVHQIVKAERFRSTKEILDLTDKFVVTHTADMEFRDPVYEQEATV
jgi:hypothetical protein